MPYNAEPIPRADEINGQTALPLARVKRIIKLDDDVQQCSNSAVFLITVATEMFIQHLAKQGMKGAQRERRKNLQYKDLANAVAIHDNLEFLSDIIPRTMPYRKVLASKNAANNQSSAVGPPIQSDIGNGKKDMRFPIEGNDGHSDQYDKNENTNGKDSMSRVASGEDEEEEDDDEDDDADML